MKIKFGKNDIFHNRIKTYPKQRVLIYDTKVYLNNERETETPVPIGNVDLYELNPGRSSNYIYPFIVKNGDLQYIQSITSDQFNSDYVYGDTITGAYRLSSSVTRDYYDLTANDTPLKVTALTNALSDYELMSTAFATDFESEKISFISIPSILFGSSIRKGSVKLQFLISGTVAAELRDNKRNGELIEVSGSSVGSTAGVVLYDHGFILLTGSWIIDSAHTEYSAYESSDTFPRWIYWGSTGSNIISSSFLMEFEGVDYTNTITMMAHAPYGSLNHSNSPTYAKKDQTASLGQPITGSGYYRENPNIQIKNIATSSFAGTTGSFQKETFISTIAIYDEEGGVLGYAKMATPVKKREKDSYTFKLKVDI